MPERVTGGARLLIALAVTAVLLAAALPLRDALERHTLPPDDAELALFPTGSWVRPLAFGRTHLAADLTWLEAIQYYGKHRETDRRYPYTRTLFETLTRLDPRFENAYVFGALILAEDSGNLEAALALLKRGIRENPESWLLVFEYGFTLYLHGNDPEGAAVYFERASRMAGAPDWVKRLAAYSAKKAGRREMAIRLWSEIYRQTDNDEIRRVAREYLRELGVRQFQVDGESN